MANSSSGQLSWKVTSQAPRFGIGPDGKATEGIEINFTTGLGNQGSVFVPRSGFSAQAGIEAIRAHAQELDAVSSSGG